MNASRESSSNDNDSKKPIFNPGLDNIRYSFEKVSSFNNYATQNTGYNDTSKPGISVDNNNSTNHQGYSSTILAASKTDVNIIQQQAAYQAYIKQIPNNMEQEINFPVSGQAQILGTQNILPQLHNSTSSQGNIVQSNDLLYGNLYNRNTVVNSVNAQNELTEKAHRALTTPQQVVSSIQSAEQQGIKKCPYCAYQNSNNYFLTRHIDAIHEKNKTYLCHHCEFKTSYRNNMKVHLRKVHKLDNGSLEGNFTFKDKRMEQKATPLTPVGSEAKDASEKGPTPKLVYSTENDANSSLKNKMNNNDVKAVANVTLGINKHAQDSGISNTKHFPLEGFQHPSLNSSQQTSMLGMKSMDGPREIYNLEKVPDSANCLSLLSGQVSNTRSPLSVEESKKQSQRGSTKTRLNIDNLESHAQFSGQFGQGSSSQLQQVSYQNSQLSLNSQSQQTYLGRITPNQEQKKTFLNVGGIEHPFMKVEAIIQPPQRISQAQSSTSPFQRNQEQFSANIVFQNTQGFPSSSPSSTVQTDMDNKVASQTSIISGMENVVPNIGSNSMIEVPCPYCDYKTNNLFLFQDHVGTFHSNGTTITTSS